MEQYEFARVMSDKHGLLLSCIDSSELESLISQLKRFFPNMHFNQNKLPSGEIYNYHIDQLSSRDDDARWWVIKQLCLEGWEPFDKASVVYGGEYTTNTDLHYYFRRRVGV